MMVHGLETHAASATIPGLKTWASICPNPACSPRCPAPSGIRIPAGRIKVRFVSTARGVDPAKVFVAGQAVDSGPFTQVQPVRGGHTEVLFVGQFTPFKGIDVLLSAWNRVNTGARLRIIGS